MYKVKHIGIKKKPLKSNETDLFLEHDLIQYELY